MKVAVPTRANVVDDHFGHCEAYSIFAVDDNNQIVSSEILPAPQGCGCKSNIAGVLQQKGVTVMLAGNMGTGALNVLSNHGIKVYRGCTGDVLQLAEAFLLKKITDSGVGCSHTHDDGHECSH